MLQSFFRLFPSVTHRINTDKKILFLTFDDGPVPEVTPEVLDLLAKNKACATFFCIGENIQKHPAIFDRIISEGHAIGNHTFNHLNGWHTAKSVYAHNAEQCSDSIDPKLQVPSILFRPPYGKMTPGQYWWIRKRYKIIMWDVLTRDWESGRSPESCFKRIKDKAANGSIVVFHDSIKAKSRMIPALQMTLKHYFEQGYTFESLAKYI